MGSAGIAGALALDGVVLRLRDWRASRPLPLPLYAGGMVFLQTDVRTKEKEGMK